MKKIFSLILACLMLLPLAACAKSVDSSAGTNDSTSVSEDSASNSDSEEEEEEKGNGLWEGETSKIIMTYMTMGATPADLMEVQAAVNEISIPKVGVEVEFKAVSAYDAMSQFPLWIGGGEQIDLMMLLLQDVKQYEDQGLLEPLSELIQNNAPFLSKAIEEFPLAGGTYVNGDFYGLTPISNGYGDSGGFIVLKKYVDEVDFDFDKEKIYTLDEVTALLMSIKEKHPEMYPNATTPLGSGGSLYNTAGGLVDLLGGTMASGVLMDTQSTTIVNLFASAEYEAYVRTMREWNLAGLTHPDAATTSSTNIELIISGVGAGYLISGHPVLAADIGNEEVCQLLLSEPAVVSLGSIGSYWTVPFTAAKPEAAMRFLDLMYSDHELSNLIQWGIEGKHYIMEDESIGLISFPQDVDANTSGYYNTLGLYGDRRFEYIWTVNTSPAIMEAYSQKALANKTKAVGYAYDNSSSIAQIAAITAIIMEYAPSLDMGSVDVDTVLPEFIAKLESAGIEDVIADNQAQFDAWLAIQ